MAEVAVLETAARPPPRLSPGLKPCPRHIPTPPIYTHTDIPRHCFVPMQALCKGRHCANQLRRGVSAQPRRLQGVRPQAAPGAAAAAGLGAARTHRTQAAAAAAGPGGGGRAGGGGGWSRSGGRQGGGGSGGWDRQGCEGPKKERAQRANKVRYTRKENSERQSAAETASPTLDACAHTQAHARSAARTELPSRGRPLSVALKASHMNLVNVSTGGNHRAASAARFPYGLRRCRHPPSFPVWVVSGGQLLEVNERLAADPGLLFDRWVTGVRDAISERASNTGVAAATNRACRGECVLVGGGRGRKGGRAAGRS
jgi:hypothetical protein